MMLHTLTMGLKTLLYSIANYGNTNRQQINPNMANIGLREEEVSTRASSSTAPKRPANLCVTPWLACSGSATDCWSFTACCLMPN